MTPTPDPFFDRLSRLLPEADIVIVPDRPRDEPAAPLDPVVARRDADDAAARAGEALRRWWSVGAPGLAPPRAYELRWLAGSEPGEVTAHAQARVPLPAGDLPALVAQAQAGLSAHGCVVRAVAPNGMRVITYRDDSGHRVHVEAAAIEMVECWEVLAYVTGVRVDALADTLARRPARCLGWASQT